MDLAVNILAISTGLFATGRIVTKFGMPATIAMVPVMICIGLLVLAISPLLGVVVMLQIIRRSGNYAVTRPAREMLFTLVDQETRFKAKPVIDIMIGLIDFNTANNHISAITELGYTYVSEFENEMPYRKFFTKEFNGKRSHHIHMVELKTEFWNRHLKFRNHLRLDNEDRDKYMDLKMNLAKREWTDVNEYASAKSEFIRNIEKSS